MPDNETEIAGEKVEFTSYHYMERLAQANGNIGDAELIVRKGIKE